MTELAPTPMAEHAEIRFCLK